MHSDTQDLITTTKYNSTQELLVKLTAKLTPFKEWLSNEGSFRQVQIVNDICPIRELGLDFTSLIDTPERPDSEHGIVMIERYAPLLDHFKSAIDELRQLNIAIKAQQNIYAFAQEQFFSAEKAHSQGYPLH